MRKGIMVLVGGALALAAADSGGIAGPVSGFVLDGRWRALRAIEGLPGAARLGGAARLPFAVGAAATAAQQDYALVTPMRGSGQPVLAQGLRSGAPRTARIDGSITATAIALSDGGAAAIYSNIERRLQFLTGLPAAPRALEPADASLIEGGAVALTIDRAGNSAALAAADGQIWFAADRGATPLRAVARLSGASAVAMLPGGNGVLAVSAASGDAILIDGLQGAVSIRAVAGASSAIGPARSAVALDDRTAAIIAADGRLATVDLETGAAAWIPLPGLAQNFEPLDRSLFLLNRAGEGPLLLLDASRRSAWFVPADAAPPIGRPPDGAQHASEDRSH